MEIIFSNKQISLATTTDASLLVQLLNSAYRGESSKKGWTTEAGLIAGNTRTTIEAVTRLLQEDGSVFLKCTPANNNIAGCVNLQQHAGRIYLGMLAVDPHQQATGIGKQLLFAAEEYAIQCNCAFIYMSVISLRKELINWYIKHGYKDTGERKVFTEDGVSGKHLQQLEFVMLEKQLQLMQQNTQ